MKLNPTQARLLVLALHLQEGAQRRWAATPRLSDAALERRISEEFGIRGGFCSCGHFVECFGGSSPKVVIQTPEHPPLLLQGQQLLRAVRQVLHISRPDELF